MSYFAVVDKGSVGDFVFDPGAHPGGYVIVVDKPYKWTSADVVRKIKFTLQNRFKINKLKVGHAGTLDPLAQGVLVICVGKATKVAEELQAQPKEYIADICFGATTPSFDLETDIDATYPVEHITTETIDSVLESFKGEIDQLPPVYSAKYVDGVRAYEKVRNGEHVELRPSRVTIYDLERISYADTTLKVGVRCSKGTYIRSLARDISEALGTGGHLTALVRTASGGFTIENSLTIDELIMKLS